MNTITVQNPGLYSLIVDPGRHGFGALGVPPSSVLDDYACRALYHLTGNADAPVIEVVGPRFALRFDADCAPENVIDGASRIVGKTSHLWASDPQRPFPQWLELDFGREVELNSVRLTFDTDLNLRQPAWPAAKQCVKDYRVSCFDGKAWQDVATVNGNFLRHRVHAFPTMNATKLRLTVDGTNGEPSARVFEVRAYREP